MSFKVSANWPVITRVWDVSDSKASQPAPRGTPQIEVTFDIDANGILHVTARDKATGREQKVTITASSGLAKDEVEKMVQDAKQHAQEDRQRREEIEERNRADSLAYQAEHTLQEMGEKIAPTLRGEVEERVKALRDALAGTDMTRIRSASADLASTTERIGQEAPAQPGAAPLGRETASAPSGQEAETIEGEYHEV